MATIAPTQPAAESVIGVHVLMPGSENIEGTSWNLYTTSASQAAVAPYLTGSVGAGNRIELIDLPPATYRLVVQPAGFQRAELTFVADGTSAEYDLQVLALTTPTPTSHDPTATSVPTSTATANPTVSALPDTGTVGSANAPMLLLITASGFVALIITAFVVRRNDV